MSNDARLDLKRRLRIFSLLHPKLSPQANDGRESTFTADRADLQKTISMP
jgi:hypothetical protein